MYSTLRSDNPQARSSFLGLERIPWGEISPTQASNRSQTLCAAFTEICCPPFWQETRAAASA
jgi:hypothetical protein